MIHVFDYVYDLEIDVRELFPEIPLFSIYGDPTEKMPWRPLKAFEFDIATS